MRMLQLIVCLLLGCGDSCRILIGTSQVLGDREVLKRVLLPSIISVWRGVCVLLLRVLGSYSLNVCFHILYIWRLSFSGLV